MLITKTQRRAKGTAHKIRDRLIQGTTDGAGPESPGGSLTTVPPRRKPWSCLVSLSCPSEHGGGGRGQAEIGRIPAPVGGCLPPLLSQGRRVRRGWHPCRPTRCWALGPEAEGISCVQTSCLLPRIFSLIKDHGNVS